MQLNISNVAKKKKDDRTAMSQQSLVNALLAEKAPKQPNVPATQTANVQPVKEW